MYEFFLVITRVLDCELVCEDDYCFLLIALATASKAWLRDLEGDMAALGRVDDVYAGCYCCIYYC